MINDSVALSQLIAMLDAKVRLVPVALLQSQFLQTQIIIREASMEDVDLQI
jgi:hypothetical protein